MNINLQIIAIRSKICATMAWSLFSMLFSVITFPITYIIFGYSPDRIMDWSFDRIEMLAKEVKDIQRAKIWESAQR